MGFLFLPSPIYSINEWGDLAPNWCVCFVLIKFTIVLLHYRTRQNHGNSIGLAGLIECCVVVIHSQVHLHLYPLRPQDVV